MDQMKLPLSEQGHAQQTAPDVFDMDLACEAAREAPDTRARVTEQAASTSPANPGFRMHPAYIMLASLLAGAVWIIWPAVSRTAPAHSAAAHGIAVPVAATPSAPSPRAVHPAQLPAASSSASDEPATAEVQASSPTVEVDTRANSDGSRTQALPMPARQGAAEFRPPPASITVDARILAEQASQAAAMITAIDAMAQRMAELEARVGAISQARASAKPDAQRPPAVSPRGAQAKQQRKVAPSAEQRAPAAYQLNTIFRDQAWVAYGDAVHVVQAGDRLGQLTVVRVDAAARRVLTSRGVIR